MKRNADDPKAVQFILENFRLIDGELWRKYKHEDRYRPTPGCIRDEYKAVRVQRKFIKVHNIVAILKTGKAIPSDMVCDHIDGDYLNNHESNIRIVPASINSQNSKPRASLLNIPCVCYRNYGKFKVSFTSSGLYHYVGQFDTLQAAIDARNASLSLHSPDRLKRILAYGS